MVGVIAGIVLAAGASSRMGRPKALLRIGDRTFVAAILAALQPSLCEIVVVIRPGQTELLSEIARNGPARAIENPDPDGGQLSSLIVGLDAIDRPTVDAALVTLVDVPRVSAEAVRTLAARARESSAPPLRAVHGGGHGPPVIFKRAVFEALRQADPSRGAKDVVRAFPVEDVEVGEPGVTEDVDTPEDY